MALLCKYSHIPLLLHCSENILGHARFVNLYGQPEARLSLVQKLHRIARKETSFPARVAIVLLFLSPVIHLRSLRKIWMEQEVNGTAWKRFIENVQKEREKILIPVCRYVQMHKQII
jgi:hypothetical protein